MRRALTTLVVPEGLLLLGAAAAVRWPGALSPIRPVVPVLPAVVLGAGLVLAIRFQRSGALLALATLAAAGGALHWAGSAALPVAVAILLPANLLALALLPERGLTSAAAGARLGVVAGQALVLLVLARTDQGGMLEPLGSRDIATFLPATSPVGDLALLISGATVAALATLTLRRADPLRRGFMWAVAASFLAFVTAPARDVAGLPAPTFLFTIAGLSVTVALVEAAYAMAFRDALTGLPNRRAFDDALRRLGGPFTVAMVDVDHFKTVNDQHGHDVGDQVLRLVAGHLEGVPEGGRAFRYGGEEFAILFDGRTEADVLPALEVVRTAVAESPFTLRGADRPRRRPKQPRRRTGARQLAVTVSVGVAQRTARDTDAATVVARADAALYRAKQGGRNRIEVGRAARQG